MHAFEIKYYITPCVRLKMRFVAVSELTDRSTHTRKRTTVTQRCMRRGLIIFVLYTPSLLVLLVLCVRLPDLHMYICTLYIAYLRGVLNLSMWVYVR